MRLDEIEQLLDKFYDGTTTPEEEQQLWHYFKNESVPPHLEADAELLRRLNRPSRVSVPASLEGKLVRLIDGNSSRPSLFIGFRIGAFAAGIALLLGLSFWFSEPATPTVHYVDTYSSPEEAYDEAQRVLALVSGKLNEGLDEVGKLERPIEKTREILDKQFD